MSTSLAPVLIGLAAAPLLLVLIGTVLAARGLVERIRLRRRWRHNRSAKGEATSEDWVYRSRAPSQGQTEPYSRTTAASDVATPNGSRQSSSAAVEEAQQEAGEFRGAAERQDGGPVPDNNAEAARVTRDARRHAGALLQEAELEAKRIVVAAGRERARYENELEQERVALERRTRLDSVATVQEALRRAEELVAAAELQCTSLVREAESEAQRKAAVITEDGRRRAREQLEAAELEAKRIIVDTGQDRARLLNDLEHERSLLEETRTKLGSLAAIEEAARTAAELLVAAERRREELVTEGEAEAERKAAEADDARRQAKELLERSQLEAASIVESARQERARLVEELAHERSVVEETRTRLSGFLADMLKEVDSRPAASVDAENVRDLGEARAARTSTGAGP